VNVHVGHDCNIGSHVIIANNVMLAGHVIVEDFAYLAGGVAVQQFVRVRRVGDGGRHVGPDAGRGAVQLANGYPARIVKMNRINLERRGLAKERIDAVERAFRIVSATASRRATRSRRCAASCRTRPKPSAWSRSSKSERGFARRR
jgi:UDP-N-acetylglucosamine acyltransferase